MSSDCIGVYLYIYFIIMVKIYNGLAPLPIFLTMTILKVAAAVHQRDMSELLEQALTQLLTELGAKEK